MTDKLTDKPIYESDLHQEEVVFYIDAYNQSGALYDQLMAKTPTVSKPQPLLYLIIL